MSEKILVPAEVIEDVVRAIDRMNHDPELRMATANAIINNLVNRYAPAAEIEALRKIATAVGKYRTDVEDVAAEASEDEMFCAHQEWVQLKEQPV